MNLTEVDKAYIAGFFDGEGCVGYYNASRTSKNRPGYFHASVNICNTDPRVIQWLQSATQMGQSKVIRFKDGKRRIAYQWQIGKRSDVMEFLVALRPYLKVKHDQVDVLLAHFSFERNYMQKHGSVTPEVVESRQQVADKLKSLKRLGVLEGVETRHVGSSIH